MTAKFLVLGLTVVSLVGYQLAQRAMPTGTNPFTVVAIAYSLGILACLLLAPRVGQPLGLSDAALLMHWPIWGLAISVVGIEIGYLLAYRTGSPVGITTGITFTSTMVLLAVIGALFFSEGITLRRTAGILLAIGGVWLLAVPARTP